MSKKEDLTAQNKTLDREIMVGSLGGEGGARRGGGGGVVLNTEVSSSQRLKLKA